MDFIFVIGPPAVGKTTLAGRLYKRLGGVYIEQNMIPEFVIPPYVLDQGEYEERVCFGAVLSQIEYFQRLGLRNIVVTDLDDLRARELPSLFKGRRFIILRLFSSDPEQIRVQMIHRAKNEGGLVALKGVSRLNALISERPLLPNEVRLDVAGKTREQILEEAVSVIASFEPLLDYDYLPDDMKNYHSWVKSRGLSWELTVE